MGILINVLLSFSQYIRKPSRIDEVRILYRSEARKIDLNITTQRESVFCYSDVLS